MPRRWIGFLCRIWGQIWSVLCGFVRWAHVPGGEGGGGGGGDDEDLLSALPDDVLDLILVRLPSAAAAARTSVLSRRWRHLWVHLPELRFPFPTDHEGPSSLLAARAALAAHSAPSLRLLRLLDFSAAAPDTATAVLQLAAGRLIGNLAFAIAKPKVQMDAEWQRVKQETQEEAEARGAVELPCCEKATEMCFTLGYLVLMLPPSGVFAELTLLLLENVRFDRRCDLSDTISTARCPRLRELRVCQALGLYNLAIHSESLLVVYLRRLEDLMQLTVVALKLRELDVFSCHAGMTLGADIYAPVLEILNWSDPYGSRLVHLGEMVHLQKLGTFGIAVYGQPAYHMCNFNSLMLMKHFQFQKIPVLTLLVAYPTDMVDVQYLMEDVTLLPEIDNLCLGLSTRGHSFGPCVFHLLRICTRIIKLEITLIQHLEEQTCCSPNCMCYQPQDWKTQDILLNFLQEVVISHLSGVECELAFVERLLSCAPVLKAITLNFDRSATVSEELCKNLLGLSSTETCMKIYSYHNGAKVMYASVV